MAREKGNDNKSTSQVKVVDMPEVFLWIFYEHFEQHRIRFKSTNVAVYTGQVMKCNFDLL